MVKSVSVDAPRVRIEFTPTSSCPALDAMRRQMEEAVVSLGGEPQVDVVLDDSWSTDRITAEGREKLREAGFAPPPPRAEAPAGLVQLQRGAPLPLLRPSTETRLDNIFGPTPCRSVRYCVSCKQPFEQFKTI